MISCTFSYKNSLKTERLLDYLVVTISASNLISMVLPDTAVFIVSYAADVEGSFAVYSTVTSVISKTSKLDVVSSTTSNVVSF